jgi:hypothetical protein
MGARTHHAMGHAWGMGAWGTTIQRIGTGAGNGRSTELSQLLGPVERKSHAIKRLDEVIYSINSFCTIEATEKMTCVRIGPFFNITQHQICLLFI